MRLSPALLLSAALACQQATALTVPKTNERDLSSLLSGAFEILDQVPGLVEKAINTTLLVVRALKETVAENGITQNGLDGALGINATTGMPIGNSTKVVACPDVAVIFARGTNEPGKSLMFGKIAKEEQVREGRRVE